MSQKLKAIEFEEKNSDFEWYDKKLLHAIEENDKDVHNFFTLLSLCHTVMSEVKNGKIIYQAQSPDDNALVSASRIFGFTFIVQFSKRMIITCFFSLFTRVVLKVASQFVFEIKKKKHMMYQIYLILIMIENEYRYVF